MRILLLGGTDLTLAVARRLEEIGAKPAGVVHLGETVRISYRAQGLSNVRHADLAGWSAQTATPSMTFTDNDAIARFAGELGADLLVVAGWYHMVPAELRRRFTRGALGFHASLLPALRGGAPLPWAILSGASETGMTLFELGDGIDDGPIYGQRRIPVGPRTTVGELVAAAEAAALELVGECLPAIATGTLTARAQSGAASYGLQRAPEDGRLEWRRTAVELDRLVRAVGKPYPGAFAELDGARITIWNTDFRDAPEVWGTPGQICRIPEEPDPAVVTAAGLLVIREAADASGDDAMPRLRRAANQRFAVAS
jgi:methionyl-tRNA formyltransferase